MNLKKDLYQEYLKNSKASKTNESIFQMDKNMWIDSLPEKYTNGWQQHGKMLKPLATRGTPIKTTMSYRYKSTKWLKSRSQNI